MTTAARWVMGGRAVQHRALPPATDYAVTAARTVQVEGLLSRGDWQQRA